jgi:hypothetical protein
MLAFIHRRSLGQDVITFILLFVVIICFMCRQCIFVINILLWHLTWCNDIINHPCKVILRGGDVREETSKELRQELGADMVEYCGDTDGKGEDWD